LRGLTGFQSLQALVNFKGIEQSFKLLVDRSKPREDFIVIGSSHFLGSVESLIKGIKSSADGSQLGRDEVLYGLPDVFNHADG